ncbi:hypothetical protein Rhal01_01982 [Rubritalea halochordaticola]|uniref:LamG-like jellyroll fold domain-containing protein n=1 Tax=Rubritalea halochordaticola TaxID=714537 RepID=A0ABP9UZD4_9BACT
MNYLTSTLVFCALTASLTCSQAALIARYELNESSGGALDSSGNGYDGTPANAGSGRVYSQPTVGAGTYGAINVSAGQAAAMGTSIDFGTDGSNFGNYNIGGAGQAAIDALLEPGTGGNRIDGTMTVMAWINLDNITGVQSIFSSVQGGGSDGWRFGTNGSGLRFTTLGAQDFNQSASLTVGTWYHVAVTVNNDDITFYLNGNEIGNTTATVNYIEEAAGFEVKLGGKSTGAENMFGRMDEVKVYDTALTQGEIVLNAVPVPEPSTSGLFAVSFLGFLARRKR